MKPVSGPCHADDDCNQDNSRPGGATRHDDMSSEAEKDRGTKILIVDDDAVSRLFCSQCLAGPETRIVTAESGKKAINMAALHLPDIIVIDACLQDMSGMEVIAVVRCAWPDSLPAPGFIGISADDSTTTLLAMQNAGCRSVLTKPLASSELAKCVFETRWSGADALSLAPATQSQEAIRQRQATFYCGMADELAELDVAITRLDWNEAQRLVHRLSGAAALAELKGLAQNGRALLHSLPPIGSACAAVDSYLCFLERLAEVPPP